MSYLEPEHLLDQAEALLTTLRDGTARQVDIRRAVSSAYYGVFHTITFAAADRITGMDKQSTPRHSLVYRAIDHRVLSNISMIVSRPSLPPKFQSCCPDGGFNPQFRSVCRTVVDLQQQRNAADYDPTEIFDASDARSWVVFARAAIMHWSDARPDEREAFLLLLLFPPR